MFKVTIRTDNAAFEGEGRAAETARILRELADKIESGRVYGSVQDGNGNAVGAFAFSRD